MENRIMKWKQLVLIVAISAASAVSSVWLYGKFSNKNRNAMVQGAEAKLPANYAGYYDNVATVGEPLDFTKAASAAVPAVVHIKTKIPAKKISNQVGRNRSNGLDDWFDQFF